MAKRSTTFDRLIIDPIFQIPQGAEDQFQYSKALDDHNTEDELVVDVDDYYFEDAESESNNDLVADDTTVLLDTPSFFVFSQNLRRAPGGQQVVDIVLNITDVNGADNYEFQVTKA